MLTKQAVIIFLFTVKTSNRKQCTTELSMIIPTILKIFKIYNTKNFNAFIINLCLYMRMCDMYV